MRLASRTPPCQRVAELCSQALDRPLTLRERLALRLHLAVCVLCARYRAQLRVLRRLARKFGQGVDETVTLPPEARDRMLRALSRDA